jgi:transposase
MARPSKRTPQVEEAIIRALKAGSTRVAAAEYVGIDRTQLWRWMAQSATFRNAIMRAEAEAEVSCVGVIKKAANEGDWHAALAWLERRRYDEWGRKDRVTIDLRVLVDQIAAAEGLTDEEQSAVLAEAERLLRRSGARS